MLFLLDCLSLALHNRNKGIAMKKLKRPRTLPFKQMIRERNSAMIVHYLLRALVLLILVAQVFNRNYENVFLCVLTLVLFTIPSMIETNTRIDIPDTLENIILFFIFAAEILGEMRSYYVGFPFWDTMLHTANGFLAAAIGFSLVDILNRNETFTFKLSPLFVVIVAFCFSMTIGVVWEFFECFMDLVFGTDMQKDTLLHTIRSVALDPTHTQQVVALGPVVSVTVNGKDLALGGYLDIGLYDTMKDLFVNFLGALVFSFVGYFFAKKRNPHAFVTRFIPTLAVEEEENKDADAAGDTE
ncbi:hypothetical protein SpiGrapes_1700 [Sphaerochaeta pleomorpha str. Grapes]|uniref:Uncharacterized protein n=1 Tax=Sphaerochaeta pleomorpha (strain ATCC BAA-1885 / DSM 22778 / Grapes) TaxID=158190 RepID=G8QWZ5_SPHPG|nr:hypothetical protein [Sphaerochaeta pleomorpha]AEV29499.1 hypothetical protein SpiGrapes_1700 [Sphaerochaeta pleomorpha str. Grapes]